VQRWTGSSIVEGEMSAGLSHRRDCIVFITRGLTIVIWLLALVAIVIWGTHTTEGNADDRAIAAACLLVVVAILGALVLWR
jgi:hypothetical protein